MLYAILIDSDGKPTLSALSYMWGFLDEVT